MINENNFLFKLHLSKFNITSQKKFVNKDGAFFSTQKS